MALLTIASAYGQEPVFNASLDKNPVALGDVFSVKFTLENARGEITPPSFTDFDVVFGPSTSSSFQFINGKQSSTMTVSYTLRPRAVGSYTIGAASARVSNKLLKSKSITVEVVEGRSSAAAGGTQSRPQQGQQQGQQQARSNDANLIVQMQLSKRKVYQGEGILISFVLLSRYNNIDLGETTFPGLNGFWTEDVKSGTVSWEADYEYIKGVPYRKAILRQQLLFPQRSGTIEIEPFKLSARVNRSFFNPGTEVSASSYAQSIEVLPLPGGAPPSFNGAVGEYSFSGKVGKSNLQANDAIDLRVVISGKGNLKLVKAPLIDFPTDFEVYDPEVKDKIAVTAGGISGSRTYEYLVIPRYAGQYDLPKIEYSFFSPSRERYITESIGPFEITVEGEDGVVPEGQGAIARSRVEPLRADIRYIETSAETLKAKGSMFFGSKLYYGLLVGPLFLFLLLVLFNKNRESILGDVKTIRSKKAARLARKRLQIAKAAMDKNDSKNFYAEIFNAMYGYFSDKLNTQKAELTKPVIKAEFAARAIPETLAQEAIAIIETCEMARFAPISGQSDRMFYQRVEAFIQKMEGAFK